MNRFIKKLAVVLSLTMVFAAMPVSAFAETVECECGETHAETCANYIAEENGIVPLNEVTGLSGEGTAETPYLISSIEELKWFRDDVNGGNNYNNATVKLAESIDLGGEEWTPIGTSSAPFNGTFDGGDKTISNLVINTASKSDVGFFGRTNNGEIKKLTVNNAKVTGRLNVGVVAGTPYTSKYTNIKVTGHVEVNGLSYVGGVGGKNVYADWTDITVDVDASSYVSAVSTENGTAYRTYVGGVMGFMGEGGHTVKNVTSNIKVIGDVCDIGGITGIAHYNNNFENVKCSGEVVCTNPDETEVGGIAGTWHNAAGTKVTMKDCEFTGSVTVGDKDVTAKNGLTGTAYNASNDDESNSGSLIVGEQQVWPAEAVINGAKYYKTLKEALEAAVDGDTVTLVGDVELSESLSFDKEGTFIIDGDGYSIKPTAGYTDTQNGLLMLGASTYGDAQAAARNYTFRNVVFEDTTGWSVIRSQGVTLTVDGCTIQNCTQTNGQSLLRLDYTEANIVNTVIEGNTALMAITHNFNGNTSKTKLTVEECVVENNTFNKIAAIYYVVGGGCTINDSEFIGNDVNCDNNGAVIYLGFQEDCKVTGCLFEGNDVVDSSTSTRVAGAIFFGYEAEIKGNAFVNNTAKNAAGDALGQSVCTTLYYDCTVDLSDNYFDGREPVEGVDYFIQYKTGDGEFVLENYYTAYSFDDGGNVVLLGNLCTEHTPALVNEKAPNCAEKGYTGDTVCSDCGFVIATGEEIAKTNHTWGYNTAFDASAHWDYCHVCGAQNTSVAHSDANGDGYCDCGWSFISAPNRANPNTGVTAEMLK